MLKIIKVKDAVARLREAGMDTNVQRIEAALRQGNVYPWGAAIKMERQWVYEIYSVLLEKWVQERSEDAA